MMISVISSSSLSSSSLSLNFCSDDCQQYVPWTSTYIGAGDSLCPATKYNAYQSSFDLRVCRFIMMVGTLCRNTMPEHYAEGSAVAAAGPRCIHSSSPQSRIRQVISLIKCVGSSGHTTNDSWLMYCNKWVNIGLRNTCVFLNTFI